MYIMKRLISAIAVIASVAAVFACNKNEGKEEAPAGTALAQEVAGTYSGTFTMSVMGSSVGSENLDCTVSAATDNTVDIVLDQFTAMGSTQFSLSAEGVSVAEADGGYSLTGSIDTMSGETHITGSVSGTVGKDGSAEITFEFTPGAMPMSITGVFSSPARNNE